MSEPSHADRASVRGGSPRAAVPPAADSVRPVSGATRLSSSGRRGDLLLVASTCLVLYLAGNGRISLWDRDEPRYAEAAREMLVRHDFVVPMFNGEPRYHKPIMIYWVMAAGYALFGQGEFGARFFSAIAGTVTCLLTYRLGTRMGGRSVGLAAALMLAVAPLMMIESKLATPDALLMATLLGAFSCLWELASSGFSWRWSLGFWALLGLALLIKGPVGLGVLATALAVWLVLGRQWTLLRRMNWIAGMAVMLGVVLPWGVAVFWATGGEFYREAIGKHVIGRSLEAMDNHRGFPGYYLVATLLGLFPWSLALPLALRGVRGRLLRDAGSSSFLVGWMMGPMLLLELVRTKLPHYYLPAYPAWAILIARGLVAFHAEGNRLVRCRWGVLRIFGMMAGCGGAALAAAGFVLIAGPRPLVAPAVVLAGVLALGTLLAGCLLLRARDRAGWTALLAAWGGLGLGVSLWLLPAANACRVEQRAARSLLACAAGREAIVLHMFREPSLIFYLGRPVPILTAEESLRRFVRDHGPALTLLHADELTRLAQHPALRVEVCARVDGVEISQTETTSIAIVRLSRRSPRGVRAANRIRRDEARE